MKPRDAFEVLVRTLGLWVVVQGTWELFLLLLYSMTGTYGAHTPGVQGQFGVATFRIVLELALLLLADLVGGFAYRAKSSSQAGELES